MNGLLSNPWVKLAAVAGGAYLLNKKASNPLIKGVTMIFWPDSRQRRLCANEFAQEQPITLKPHELPANYFFQEEECVAAGRTKKFRPEGRNFWSGLANQD